MTLLILAVTFSKSSKGFILDNGKFVSEIDDYASRIDLKLQWSNRQESLIHDTGLIKKGIY